MGRAPNDDSPSTMQRRDFLRRALTGAAGAQLAAWTGACAGRDTNQSDSGSGAQDVVEDLRADVPPNGYASPALLRAAWDRARQTERPIFVLVIPSGETRWAHGEAWGELFLHGSEDLLGRLAACEIVCAEMTAVHEVLGEVKGIPREECTALLVDASGARARSMSADVNLERWPDWNEPEEEQAKPFRERIARLERGLGGLLPWNSADAELLAGAPPGGAAWATSMGCGADVDGHPEIGAGIACGMGHVPDIAQRFLYYLVDGEGW